MRPVLRLRPVFDRPDLIRPNAALPSGGSGDLLIRGEAMQPSFWRLKEPDDGDERREIDQGQD
jgi:hypothetical protein